MQDCKPTAGRSAVIRRDFEEKAPSETDIVAKLESGAYKGRYELLRDLALDLFWVNRYPFTMYDKQPMRWRDVPRQRDDIFLPVFQFPIRFIYAFNPHKQTGDKFNSFQFPIGNTY